MQFLKWREAASPALLGRAAKWFHEKWHLPESAYRESLAACGSSGIPQWYLMLEGERIAAGAGVIGNDFHDRTDLTPNLCALWVEPDFRGRGVARSLLRGIRADLASLGFNRLYLITDLRDFYERCGWRYLTAASDAEGRPVRLYAADTRPAAEQEDWARLYTAAREVRRPRAVSPTAEAGGVSAALLAGSGEVYTGVCLDTACSLGMCAERSAVANMLTHGEDRIRKLLVLMPDGGLGLPCGACRELLMQLPEGGETEVLRDLERRTAVRVRELLPDWWRE